MSIGDRSFESLDAALAEAKIGDTLRVSGTHNGNFSIDKSITLSGAEGATLDGERAGTVLVIKANGVTLEGLAITGSGRNPKANLIWGDAGIRIDGENAVLRDLVVTGCDWGVLFFGGKKSQLSGSKIGENTRDGIKVMGGREHIISDNRIFQNQVGVKIDTRYGEATEMVLPDFKDMAQMRRMSEYYEAAIHSEEVVVEDNEIRGNGMFGIHVYSKSTGIRLLGNTVSLTAREIEPDRDLVSAEAEIWGAALGMPAEQILADGERILGSGILLYCGPQKCLVKENRCEKNQGYGVALRVADDNEVTSNRIAENRVGINLEVAHKNRITGNEVIDNKDHGIAIEFWELFRPGARSAGNLLTGNTLGGSRVNAYDASGKIYTEEEIEEGVTKMPPQGTEKMMADPAERRTAIQWAVESHKPGSNSWDDGEKGNHHADFDETVEGFEDTDGNGIGDKPWPIPGGDSVDRFPFKPE